MTVTPSPACRHARQRCRCDSFIPPRTRVFTPQVCFLFATMHIGAVIASRRDIYDRKVVFDKLMAPGPEGCKFEQRGPDGAWTWLLQQDPLPQNSDVFQLTGSAINFSGAVATAQRASQ